jgi:hypothetical protein
MSTLRAWGFKLVVLVVAMLTGIGAWEIYRGVVIPGHAQFQLGSFKCYNIIPKKPVGETVILSTQFGTEEVRVTRSQLLCAPATRGGGGS